MADGTQRRPSWKFEWNPNTILQTITLIAFVWGGGTAWQAIKAGQEKNADAILRNSADIAQLKTDAKAFANIQFRVERLEDGFVGVTANTRDLERTINIMASDVRVMREIVERIDKKDRADAGDFDSFGPFSRTADARETSGLNSPGAR